MTFLSCEFELFHVMIQKMSVDGSCLPMSSQLSTIAKTEAIHLDTTFKEAASLTTTGHLHGQQPIHSRRHAYHLAHFRRKQRERPLR